MAKRSDGYAEALAIASWWLARRLAVLEDDSKRATKMRRVSDEKLALVKKAHPYAQGIATVADAAIFIEGLRIVRATKVTLLIDLLFSDPFAPYELSFNEKRLRECLEELADHLGLPTEIVDELAAVRKDATKAHRALSIGHIVLFGLGG